MVELPRDGSAVGKAGALQDHFEGAPDLIYIRTCPSDTPMNPAVATLFGMPASAFVDGRPMTFSTKKQPPTFGT
jgi:hypothetical protein